MAYLDLLENEIVSSQYLVVLKPRKRITDFVLFSGQVYVADFTLGEIVSVRADGQGLNQGSGPSLATNEFYYDLEESKIYVRLTGANPNTVWCVATFELYFGTIDAHWHRVPTDDTTRVVYFEPLLNKSPLFKQTIEGLEQGFNPIQSSSLVLINAENYFEPILHDSSFLRAECVVYHWLDELDVDNIKLVLNGFTTSARLNQPLLTINIVDRIEKLSQEYRQPNGRPSFFNITDFPNIDPTVDGRAIRTVYGLVTDGLTPTNISFVSETPTTSDNRTWVVQSGQTGLSEITRTVANSPASTTTRTYLTSVNGLNIDDGVIIDKATDEYVFITDVGANYIDHETLGVAANPGDTVRRGFVSRITIMQDSVPYEARYGRDYTQSVALSGTTSGFVFSSSLESNLSMPKTLQSHDNVFCRVYGRVNDLTLGGPSFGSNDNRTSNMAHPAQVILDFLKNVLGLTDADIDETSFTNAITDLSSGVGFSIPDQSFSNSFPTIKDILNKVLQSSLCKLDVNVDGKYSILTVKPLGAVSKEIADDEILVGIDFDYDYSDVVSEVSVEYAKQEQTIDAKSNVTKVVTVTSDVGTYLHESNSTKSIESIWAYVEEAEELANRMSYILGERRGTVDLNTKNRFYTVQLGDNIQINRIKLPGFTVSDGIINSREYAVSSYQKGRTQITLSLDDRKGIEDNAGVW